MFVSKKAGRRVSVIATISTYLQRETCFTDSWNIITSESWRKEAGSHIQTRLQHFLHSYWHFSQHCVTILSPFALIPSDFKFIVKPSVMLLAFSALWS